jgi:hypothetical protein
VWSAIVIGGVLALLSLALWHAPWLPAAALLSLTILLRFVYNPGKLYYPDEYRPNRVAYFQAISLLSVAMLALGHGAATGYFESEALSTVSDHVALSVVAAIWLVMLVRQKPREAAPETTAGEDGNATGEDVPAAEPPRSWAWLLEPNQALVSFTGREEELAALLAWCEDGQAEALRLVTGPGGIGKTRLAAELAGRLTGRGWDVRWVGRGQETAAVGSAQAGGPGRVLLIVDDAETRAGLGPPLSELTGRQGAGPRVLLLARYTGAWLDQLTAGSPALRNQVVLARQAQLALSTEVTTGRPDHKIVSQAVGSISRRFGLRESRVETRYQTSSGRQLILDLHAAALVATLTDARLADTGTGTVQADIRTPGLAQLLLHERQFWHDSARRHGLLDGQGGQGTRLPGQIIAASCLFGAATAREAGDLATRIPGFLPSANITEWLEEVSAESHSGPDQAGFMPLSRLAERHTLQELTSSPEFAHACTTGLTRKQALQAVTFLARALPDFTEASSLLTEILPDITDRITDVGTQADTLAAVLSVLPYARPTLAPAAVAGTRKLLQLLPASDEPAQRAHWLMSLGIRLAETGDLAGAAAAEQEAAIARGELAAADPDRHLPDLAASLDSVSARLSKLGDHRNAVQAAEEAAGIHRGLAAANLGLYGPALALSLNGLALRYHEAGRPARALKAFEEAAGVYRELAAANPSQYQAGLAQALGSLSLRYQEQGHAAEALPLAEEAVALYRELTAANPAQYRPKLADALDRLGFRLSGAGRAADALLATQEAVALYKQLAQASPGRHRADLTRVQTNLRVRQQRLKGAGTAGTARRRRA